VLVLQAFRRKNILWFGIAIIWHTILDAVAVFASQTWSMYVTEVLLGVLAIGSLVIVFLFREPPELSGEPLPEIEVLSLDEIESEGMSIENLEDSRYV
jgi:hypothetical protein